MKLTVLLVAGLLLGVSVRGASATETGAISALEVMPGVITEGEETTTTFQTRVTLRTPSPSYFICEVRSANGQVVVCKSIIFKKGDITATGTGEIDWSGVDESPVTIEISAYSVDAPDKRVTERVVLRKKDDESSP